MPTQYNGSQLMTGQRFPSSRQAQQTGIADVLDARLDPLAPLALPAVKTNVHKTNYDFCPSYLLHHRRFARGECFAVHSRMRRIRQTLQSTREITRLRLFQSAAAIQRIVRGYVARRKVSAT